MSMCASPIRAEVARFTLTDVCGIPVEGEGAAQITIDGFTEIQNTPNYEEGQRFLQRKANGQPCVNEQGPAFLNWLDQVVTLCTLDVDLITMVSGGEPILTDGDFSGTAFDDGLLWAHYSTEVWQPVAGADACDGEGEQRYVYWAFPHVFDAQIQAFTFQNDVFTFGYSSKTRPSAPGWDLGDPWLGDSGAGVWGPGRHFAFNITTTPPPVAGCGVDGELS